MLVVCSEFFFLLEFLILCINLLEHLFNISVDSLLEMLIFLLQLLNFLLELVDVDLLEVIVGACNSKELLLVVNPCVLFSKLPDLSPCSLQRQVKALHLILGLAYLTLYLFQPLTYSVLFARKILLLFVCILACPLLIFLLPEKSLSLLLESKLFKPILLSLVTLVADLSLFFQDCFCQLLHVSLALLYLQLILILLSSKML